MFDGPVGFCPGLPGWASTRKVKLGRQNQSGFTGARDSEWQWHQLGYIQICTLTQTHYHASIQPLSFLQAGCPSCRPTNSVKALKAYSRWTKIKVFTSGRCDLEWGFPVTQERKGRLTGPNCSKYALTSAAEVDADRPPTNIFLVRVTSCTITDTSSTAGQKRHRSQKSILVTT